LKAESNCGEETRAKATSGLRGTLSITKKARNPD